VCCTSNAIYITLEISCTFLPSFKSYLLIFLNYKTLVISHHIFMKTFIIELLNIFISTKYLIQCVMRMNYLCTCIVYLVKNNLEVCISTIHSSFKLMTYRALSFVDVIQNNVFNVNVNLKEIFQHLFVLKKRTRFDLKFILTKRIF
jgi:hypothetical protein